MRAGSRIVLKSGKSILVGAGEDERISRGTLLCYMQDRERLKVRLDDVRPDELSLDREYAGQIADGEERFDFEGRVRERYSCEDGPVAEIQIINGFFKNR